MTVVNVDPREHSLTALGIGNVETVIFRESAAARPRWESVLLRGGVVGYRLPALQASRYAIAPGDRVVFATDGVREDYVSLIECGGPSESLSQLAQRILNERFRGTDDGLVLACRYLGNS